MTGFLWQTAPVSPAEIRSHPGRGNWEECCGRRLPRRTLEELWRLWPAIPPAERLQVRELLSQAGVTARLVASAVRGNGRRRVVAIQRLLALADPQTLPPLLAAWERLTLPERQRVLALAGQCDHPGVATLLWRKIASRAPDPPAEMARLVRIVGVQLLKALGQALASHDAPLWAWESLTRLGGAEADRILLNCLGRPDDLAERTKDYFTRAPGSVLPLLMEAARFDPSWEIRVGAITALLRRKEPEAFRFLAELLRDRDWFGGGMGVPRARVYGAWPALFGLHSSNSG